MVGGTRATKLSDELGTRERRGGALTQEKTRATAFVVNNFDIPILI
jgi:hypothetical protein